MITFALIILSGIVAGGLVCGKGALWGVITAYWCLVFIKNVADMWREKHG